MSLRWTLRISHMWTYVYEISRQTNKTNICKRNWCNVGASKHTLFFVVVVEVANDKKKGTRVYQGRDSHQCCFFIRWAYKRLKKNKL
jgi:hypothetical protein